MSEDLKDTSTAHLKAETELSYMETILAAKLFISLLTFDLDCRCFYKISNAKVHDPTFINPSVRTADIIKLKLATKTQCQDVLLCYRDFVLEPRYVT